MLLIAALTVEADSSRSGQKIRARKTASNLSAAVAVPSMSFHVGGVPSRPAMTENGILFSAGPRVYEATFPGSAAEPVLTMSDILTGTVLSAATSGSYAYATLQGGGIVALSLTDGVSVTSAISLSTLLSDQAVATHPGRLYVSEGATGIRVLDTEDPSQPVNGPVVPITEFDGSPARADMVATNTEYVFAVNSERGSATPGTVIMGQITGLGAWHPVAELDMDEPISQIWATDSALYVVRAYTADVGVVDIAAVPTLIETRRLTQPNMTASYLWADQDRLYVLATDNSHQIVTEYDVTDLRAVSELRRLEIDGPNFLTGVVGAFDRLYVTDNGIRVIGITDGAPMAEIGYHRIMGNVNDMAIVDDGVLVAARNGLWLLGRSPGLPPGEPVPIDAFRGPVESVEASGGFAFVAESGARLTALRARDSEVTSINTIVPRAQTSIDELLLYGKKLHVSAQPERDALRYISTLEVDSDGGLEELGEYQTDVQPWAVSGNYLAGTSGHVLHVLRLEDPLDMRLLAHAEAPSAVASMVWSRGGDVLFLIVGKLRDRLAGNDLYAIAVSAESGLQIVHSVHLGSGVGAAALLVDEFVVVAGLSKSGQPGLFFVDASVPEALRVDHFAALPHGAFRGQLPRSVVVDGSMVMVGTSSSGIFGVDAAGIGTVAAATPTATRAADRTRLFLPLAMRH
jgi:hypothetical protein